MNLPVVDRRGRKRREIEVADEVFGIEPNRAVLHQAYVAQRANAHLGTHSTKSRGEVRGSTAKIRRQKGHGRRPQGLQPRLHPHRRRHRLRPQAARTRQVPPPADAPPRHPLRSQQPRASGGLIVVPAIADGETKTREVAAALGASASNAAPSSSAVSTIPRSFAPPATSATSAPSPPPSSTSSTSSMPTMWS